jgi:prepilin signal peptidase PulO-like enzyme (type II secretory pathway)
VLHEFQIVEPLIWTGIILLWSSVVWFLTDISERWYVREEAVIDLIQVWTSQAGAVSALFSSAQHRLDNRPGAFRRLRIEMAASLCGALMYAFVDLGILTPRDMIFFSVAFPIAAIDFFTFCVPNALSLPLIWIGLLASAAIVVPPSLGEYIASTDIVAMKSIGPEQAIFGALAGWSSIAVMNIAFRFSGRETAIGWGDAKLLMAMGAWYGPAVIGPVVSLGALFGLVQIMASGTGHTGDVRVSDGIPAGAIPFAPGLILGLAVTLLFVR